MRREEAGEPGLAGLAIYVDVNDNGSFDAGEPSDVTAADGTYQITGIEPGSYKVREVATAAVTGTWTCSFPSPCYYDETFESSDAITDNDFGNYTTATKSGHKFLDRNQNGDWDEGEPGISNWTIQAWQDGVKIAETQTLADDPNTQENELGYYEFKLDPGTYTIRRGVPGDRRLGPDSPSRFRCRAVQLR